MNTARPRIMVFLVAAAGILGAAEAARAAAELKVLLPLGRTVYQTNERIDVSVVRSAPDVLAAGNLDLVLAGEDGSRMAFTFPVGAAAIVGQEARRTEHLYLDGRLLRPGRYAVEVSADGAAARTEIEVYSHIRKTSFRLIDWVPRDAQGPVQQMMGEDGLGFNLFWGGYAPWTENLIRGGMDWMRCCTMGGAHQMDLRQECDWSDPYVLGGGIARAVRQALADRTKSNAIGVHFYDEPGLTWWKHPRTGEMVPHNVPSQDRDFLAAYARQAPPYDAIRPDDPASLADWMFLGRWKLGLLDAAWKLARFGVSYAQPEFLSANQSMYAWYAFGDGYYFNVQRSMPVLCGHGGYDEWGTGFYHPGLFMAMGRVRELAKPVWYMPTWGGQTSDRLRMQQYMSFMQNLQGMMVAPPTNVARPWAEPAADGVAESNRLMGRLGTVFTTMPPTRPPVAVLYSLSQNLYVQSRLMMKPHAEAGPGNYGNFQTDQFRVLYVACSMTQMPFFPLVEEDVLDGTLAAHHKVVLLPRVDYLDPKVVAGLEAFIASGGTVIASDDATVRIKGAKKLGVAIPTPESKPSEIPAFLKATEPVAAALRARLKECGIAPVFDCDNPAIAAWRQAEGDVEYLFAVNAACDAEKGGYNPIRPAVATLVIPHRGPPVYDAVLGGPVSEFKQDGLNLVGRFRFGAGQMRVFARTARAICGVWTATPVVRRDLTVAGAPIEVHVTATLVDMERRPLLGAFPMQVRVTDPLGTARYDLYRATDRGALCISLPLAANDPPGRWQVQVYDLLTGTINGGTFEYRPGAQCGAAAGAEARAVCFGNDRENVFRFFRLHQDVTIVKGTSDYDAAAAERLAKVLAPWGVRAKVVAAADVNKARAVPEEALKTWCGLAEGRPDPSRPEPARFGFAVDGPAILVGTPEDNPLIKFLKERQFLPYAPAKDEFPGRARGMVAWQADGIGYGNQESITLIAYDEAGMSEAVGTLYEAASGLDSLMKWTPPASAAVTPAAKAPPKIPQAEMAWRLALPDRAVTIRPVGKDRAAVLTKDGTLAVVDAAGKVAWSETIDGGETWRLDAAADGSILAVGATHHVVAFTGDGKQAFDVPMRFRQPGAEGKPVSAAMGVVVSADGKRVAVGAANGILMMVDAKGKTLWSVGGLTDAEYKKWQEEADQWKAGAEKRAAETKAFKEADAKWKEAVQNWEKADPKMRGPKPERPAAPKHPPQPRLPAARPMLDGAFSADGKSLLALTSQGASVTSADKGDIGATIGGVAVVHPVRAGEHVFVAMNDGAAILSLADGKTVSRAVLAKATVVSAAPAGEGAVVAVAEEGRTVRLKALSGKPEDMTAWECRQPGRMVKKVAAADGLTAVAYWGGAVDILDAAGTVKSSQRMAQDVADMAWLGGKLVVALADGCVIALDVK